MAKAGKNSNGKNSIAGSRDVRESDAKRSGSNLWPLILIILAALAIRALAAMSHGLIQMDETAYMGMAKSLAAGEGMLDLLGVSSAYFSPLLPLAIALLSFLVPDFILAGYMVVTLFGALTLVPVYLLTREFFGPRAALLAAGLAAVMPLLIDNSSTIYSEGLYTFFLLMAVFYGWRMLQSSSVASGAAAGLCLGLAYLANPAAVFYVIALPVLAGAVALRKGQRLRAVRPAAVFLLVFLLFAIPYVIFLHSELGRWTYSGKYVDVNVYDSTHDLRLDTPEWDRDMLSLSEDGREVKVMTLPKNMDLLGFVMQSPVIAAKNLVRQSYFVYTDLLPRITPLWLLPLLGLGLFARGWNRRRAGETGYILAMMTPVVLVLAMYAHTRFFVPYLALAVGWMGAGWQRLEEWAGSTLETNWGGNGARKEIAMRFLPWIVAAAVLLPTLGYAAALIYNPSPGTEFREAGEWVRENVGAGKEIMSRESPSPFYAGGRPHFLPYAEYEATTRYARYQGIDLMVIRRQAIIDLRPHLKILLEDDAAHPEWRLLHAIRPGTAEETLIFELVK